MDYSSGISGFLFKTVRTPDFWKGINTLNQIGSRMHLIA